MFPIGPDGRYQYPKRSAAELRAIYERNPCPEVRDLLWEIHRLRVLLLRANQLQQAYDAGCHTSHMQILEIFRAEILRPGAAPAAARRSRRRTARLDYPPETWPDYAAPIIVGNGDGARQALVGTFGMVPKSRILPGVAKYDTTNARLETVGEKRPFSGQWKKGQLCPLPAYRLVAMAWTSRICSAGATLS